MTPAVNRCLLVAFLVIFVQVQSRSLGESPKPRRVEGLIYATFPGQQDPTKDSLNELVSQAQWDDADSIVGDTQHLKLRFDKVDDQNTPKGIFARYRIFAEGAPANKVYGWSIWLFGHEAEKQPGDLYVNARGLLLTHKPTPEEELSLHVPGGELYVTPQADSAVPVRYEIFSRDDQLRIPGTLVPQPLVSTDNGCRLEARIALPNAAAVLLVADGFPLESKIPLVLESEDQTVNLTMTTDSGGHFILGDFPFVRGKTQGTLKATAEGPDCLPAVTLPWGGDAQAASPADPKDQTAPKSDAAPPAKKKLWPLHH